MDFTYSDELDESIINEDIENALRESPSSAKWDGVEQLNIADPRSLSWQRYQERLSGVPAEELEIRDYNSDIVHNTKEMQLESSIWWDISSQILKTFNSLLTDTKAIDLNDKTCASMTTDEIINLYGRGIDDDILLKKSILIDIHCDPIVQKFSEKVGDVGKCCVDDFLRSKSNTMALQDICSKRTDLGGTTDWVMRRYGGSRRESSIFVSLMWWVSIFSFLSCGKYGMKKAIDSCIGMFSGSIIEALSYSDGDRTTHRINKTELASAVISSADKSLTLSARVRAAIETVIASRKVLATKYNELYNEMSTTANPEDVTPKTYLMSRYVDAMFTCIMEIGV